MGLANPPRNQLRVLGAEIHHENGTGSERFRATRLLHSAEPTAGN